MGLSLRKSMKVGPFRVNLSQSGVGISAGVKGLRVGANSKGRTYTSASAFGITHRQVLGGGTTNKTPTQNAVAVSSPRPSIPLSDELTAGGVPVKKLPKWPWLLLPATFILTGVKPGFAVVFVLSAIILPIVYLILYLVRDQKRTNAKNAVNRIKKALAENNLSQAEEILRGYLGKPREPDLISFVVAATYTILHPVIAADLQIDALEKQFIDTLRGLAPNSQFNEIDIYYLRRHIGNLTADGVLDPAEKKFLQSYCDTFAIPTEARAEMEACVSYYEVLDKIRAGSPPLVTPSVTNIDEAQACFFEGVYELLNEKSRTVKESGQLFITKGSLQFLGVGHKKVKFSDLLAITEEAEDLYLSIKNRKTPMVISTNDNLIVKTLIASQMG